MTIALWMILIAALLPYLTVGIAKFSGGDYDNATPRVWSATLSGWRARAYARCWSPRSPMPRRPLSIVWRSPSCCCGVPIPLPISAATRPCARPPGRWDLSVLPRCF